MNKNIFTVGDTVQVRGDRVGVIETFTKSDKYDTILCQLRYSPKIVENVYLADVQHYNKDYTILSYGNSESLDKYEIKSVRRNSDGVVFTIGDKIQHLNYTTDSYNAPICRIISFGDTVQLIRNHNYQSESSVILKCAQHAKKPLFTTEDGKDIFDGGIYYEIRTGQGWLISSKHAREGDHRFPSIKNLSTKEAAEEWILMNKPLITLKDLYDHSVRNGFDLNELRRLVKSRL